MSGLKALTMMQLKDKIDMSFLGSTKKTIFKVVLSLLKFIIITALIWVGFFLLDYLNLVSLLPGIPQEVFAIVFTPKTSASLNKSGKICLCSIIPWSCTSI